MKKYNESVEDIKNYFEKEIIPYINIIKSYQSKDGSIIDDKVYIEKTLYILNEKVSYIYKPTNNEILARSFEQDIQNWIDTGLEYKPDFINSLETLNAPNNHELVMFVGPVKCPNGPKPTGYFFESILAQRYEPQLVKEIVSIEKIDDDDEYKKSAKSLVMKYLPNGEGDARFSTPKSYENLTDKIKATTGNLDFKIMSY